MAIVNFNNCGGEPRQLYRVRYDTGQPENEQELYVLASDFQCALDMFPAFYTVYQHDPKDIPLDVSEEHRRLAMGAVRGIDRIADVVLALK